MPKKAVSAYLHFCTEMRPQLKAEDPTVAPNDLMKGLGERWNALPLEEKAKYEALEREDKARYAQECTAAGIDPDEARARRKKPKEGGAEGEEGGTPKKKRKSRAKQPTEGGGGGEGGGEGEGEGEGDADLEVELLPWAVPSGFEVAGRPDVEALQPSSAAAKGLLGRRIMYHWQDVGWCQGVLQKCNGDKRKTVDGDSAPPLDRRCYH